MRKTEAGSNAMFSRRCARRMNTYGCDLDGNATLARASTRTWRISCNGENHPSRFENAETQTVVECAYDCHGRRCAKKVSVAGTATRPLTFRHAEKGLMLFYAFDGNKNVSDVFFFALQNGIGAHYEYAPFGAVTRTSKATGSKVDLIGANPWRFSSEFYDSELDLVYYNYRHYSPAMGRWLSRDPIQEQGGLNLYAHCENNPIGKSDILGRAIPQLGAGPDVEAPQPPKPDCTERIRAFEKWIEEEAKDLTWLDKIPACPKKLSCKEEEKSISIVYPNGSVCVTKVKGLFCNSPDPSRWALTSDLLFHCFSESGHPGGKYELRTIPKDEYGGAGNQCIYDESGNLVEMHPTAGTADKYSPGSGILDGIIRAPKHNLVDVRPFKEAQYLDRNCGGNGIYEQKYYTVRPAK